ncbi:MAG TPA: hypothetical protein VMV48_14220 [Gallionellaceae bacterium]|nr:hypothetical protein [Gallionellaceae bacterium]
MAKIKSPLRFSRHFGIKPELMQKLGVFDPILEADTPLFIDPVLVTHSSAIEISSDGFKRMEEYFSDLYRLILASKREGDAAWSTARKYLQFHEVPGTCLGYGGGSIHGSGWGPQLTSELLTRANEIIKAGVDDHRIFLLIGLFSEGIGPDRLSDMSTNIMLPDIATYTERICNTLEIELDIFKIEGSEYFLPRNPLQIKATPILLLPRDILRDLPVAFSVEEIWEAAAHNEALRIGIHKKIGVLWEKANKEQKGEVLQALLKDPEYAHKLIDRLTKIKVDEYDQVRDERGHLIWADLAYDIASTFPKSIAPVAVCSTGELNRVVVEIIKQFKFLMEQRDLWRVLNDSDSRKTEKTAQRIFFAVAFAYCIANNLDITPEADTGNGPIDFKFSGGFHSKILVELKLSKNDVLRGHNVQLPIYIKAERADYAHYVVINVGHLGQKWQTLQAERKANKQSEPAIWLIDAEPRESASTRS